MSSEIVTGIARDERRPAAAPHPWRTLAIQLIGPLTVVGGLVWAVAQPYRVAILDRAGHGLWDYLFEGPVLVVAVGLVFTLAIAPGLVADLEAREQDASES